MSEHSHPYTNLPKHAFWKTAVAELASRQIDLAWRPKSPISGATKIITVGSCFAQHISKSFKENGFIWLDSEPAHAELPPAEHAKHGYGVFSFRTGNIYTAALLKQWVMWTTGKAKQSTESFLNGGRYFDPFRPSLTPRDLVTLLHWTTEYPAPYDEVNLQAMVTMQRAFGVKVGYCGHTPGIEIPSSAVLGARSA